MNVKDIRIFLQLVAFLSWNPYIAEAEEECILENREGEPKGILVPASQCTSFREELQNTELHSTNVCCPVFQNEPNCGRISEYAGEFSFDSRETQLDQFPWAAMVMLQWVRKIVCSGSLISTRFVLSAAHCFVDVHGVSKPASDYRVRLGDWDLVQDEDCMYVRNRYVCNPQKPVDYSVELIVTHDSYHTNRKDFLHDIALLKLAQPVEYGAQIGPACLPNWSTEVPDIVRQNFTATGWGRTKSFRALFRKYKLEMMGRNISTCVKAYRMQEAAVSRIQLCVGGVPSRDVCYGDSGGGLMKREANRWVLIGVISFGSYRCGRSLPGVYTNAAYYSDWIQWAVDKSSKSGIIKRTRNSSAS
uniref:Peptidase S1 domain-containing protein n=1 Tax=Anopheles funestus TaxID=62324 RepID=A0A182RA66_ANOFN